MLKKIVLLAASVVGLLAGCHRMEEGATLGKTKQHDKRNISVIAWRRGRHWVSNLLEMLLI